MKIDKKQFNKLSQLDRIEFRQRRNEIDEKYPLGISGTVNSIFICIFYLMIIVIMRMYILLSGLTFTFNPTFWVLFIIPLSYIGDMINMIINSKKTRELTQEYFKIEVKKK